MTTNLPAVITDEELMALTGQGAPKQPSLPRLFFNKESVDDHENDIPVGTFAVRQGDEHGVYAKTATFRPFVNVFQYSFFDSRLKKTTNRTIKFDSWNDEAIDELGGLRCGKKTKKEAKDLSKEELEKNSLVKCHRHVYGTVTMSGVDEKKNEVQLNNLPVRMKLGGSNFMPMDDALGVIIALKRPYPALNINMTLTRQKNGATVWYTMTPSVEVKTIIPVTTNDIELLKTFRFMIGRENEFIANKYREAIKGKGTSIPPWEGESVIDALDADFNDDISDIGR